MGYNSPITLATLNKIQPSKLPVKTLAGYCSITHHSRVIRVGKSSRVSPVCDQCNTGNSNKGKIKTGGFSICVRCTSIKAIEHLISGAITPPTYLQYIQHFSSIFLLHTTYPL